MKCFFHSGDLDGACSAAIVRRKYPDCELIGINYGQPFPWDSIKPREQVFMVDFSLQPFEDMIRLRLRSELIWIDHHRSAIKEADETRWTDGEVPSPGYVPGIREEGIGACVLTWRYLFPDEPVPRAVQLLGEYDVYDRSDIKRWEESILPFQYGMRSLGSKTQPHTSEPDDPYWGDIFGDGDEYTGAHLADIISDGELILEYQSQQNEGYAKTLCFDTELDGLKLLAANAGPTNSKFFDSLWDSNKYDAMCLFSYRPKGKSWTISLYTDKPGVDCGAFCKGRSDDGGGGGHPGAAGFQCVELPFELRGAK